MIKLKDLRLAVALPTYDGRRMNGLALINLAKAVPFCTPIEVQTSILTLNFNNALCRALELRKSGEATHFLMMHDDIIPTERNWIDIFWREYISSDAQILSAVAPIKDHRGLSSVARDCGPTKWSPRRMTMHEIMREPQTFSYPDILLNTGLMLFSLDEPWLPGMAFTFDNEIVADEHGRLHSRVEPEDWRWCRDARQRGCARMYATRAVKLVHQGQQLYPNDQAWGQQTDEDWARMSSVG